MTENLEFRKVRDFGELVHDTFVFVKQCWKPLLFAYFTIAGILIVASTGFSILYSLKLSSILSGGGLRSNPSQIYDLQYFLTLAAGLLNYMIGGLVTLCFIALYIEKNNQAPTTEEVWSYVKYYFLRYAASYIVFGLLLIVATIFCFFPGVWLWPILSVAMAVIVFENASLGYSFDRCFKLIKQNWWTTFGALFIIYLITWGLTMVIVMPTSVISMGSLFLGKVEEVSVPLLILNSVLTGLCNSLLVLPAIALALCYFSLAETTDGSGLLGRIDMLGKNQLADNLPTEEY